MNRRLTVAAIAVSSLGLLAACSNGVSASDSAASSGAASTAGATAVASVSAQSAAPETTATASVPVAALSAEVVTSTDVPLFPTGPAIGSSELWYWDDAQGSVIAVDVSSGMSGSPISLGNPAGTPQGSPKTVAVGTSGVWAADAKHHSVDLLDAADAKVSLRIPIKPDGGYGVAAPVTPYGLGVDGDVLWVTDFDQGLLVAVNAKTKKVTRVVTGLGHPGAVAIGFDSVWVYEYREGVVVRIDPATGRVTATIKILTPDGEQLCSGCADNLAVGTDAIWVPLYNYKGVGRIDPTTNTDIATIPLSIISTRAFADDRGVWLAGGGGGMDENAEVVHVDSATSLVSGAVPVPYAANVVVAPDGGDLWVGTAEVMDSGSVVRMRIDG